MKSLDQFFQSDIVEALGWTIIHSFWQGLLIVVMLTACLIFLRKQSSQRRYLAGYLALTALALCCAGTFFLHYPDGAVGKLTGDEQLYLSNTTKDIPSASMPELMTSPPSEATFLQSIRQFIEGNLPLVSMVWLLGVMLLSLKFLAELAFIQRLKFQPGQLSNAVYQDRLNKIADQMGLKKAIEIKENIRIGSPMVIGIFKPVILLPFGLINQLQPEEVESILAHELAHIQRNDYILNLLQSLMEIALFFNPATWWISSLIRNEREHCCDEMAIDHTGNQLVYIKTLAKLEEYRSLPDGLALAFNGRHGGGVLGRVQRILNNQESFRLPFKLFWSSVILIVCSIGLLAFQTQPALPSGPISASEVIFTGQDSSLTEVAVLSSPGSVSENPAKSEAGPKGIHQPASENGESGDIQEAAGKAPTLIAARPLNHPNPADTLPENLKKLRLERILMEKEYRQQEIDLQLKQRQINTAVLQLEREIKKIENDQVKKLFDLEKNAQEIQLQRNIQLQEFEIENNQIENQALELEYDIQQLKRTPPQPSTSRTEEERHNKLSALNRRLLDLELKKRDLALNQKRMQLEVEKEIQQINNKRWELQEMIKMDQNDRKIKIMELQEKLQDVQLESQLLQKQKLSGLEVLQLQMQLEMEKLEGKDKEE